MNYDIPEKVIDITGVELTPGKPDVCLGNGEQGFECCCDECDYYSLILEKYIIKLGYRKYKTKNQNFFSKLFSKKVLTFDRCSCIIP